MKKRKGFFDDIEESDNTEKEADAEKVIGNKADDVVFPPKTSGFQEDVREKGASEALPTDGVEPLAAESNEEGGGRDDKGCGCKKRNAAIFSGLAIVLCAFVFVSVAYALGMFNDKYTVSPGAGDGPPKEEFYYYPADYETDIFTMPEYLALDRTVKYSPDSSQSYLIENGDYAAEGEPGLTVIGEYLKAVIAGDSEKVNSLYTEKYIEEKGAHAKFPPQKLFKIKIRNEREVQEKSGYTVYYFTVSYRIFRNDGLFREGVDENRERAQIFEVFVYADESVKINRIIDRPGYMLDI